MRTVKDLMLLVIIIVLFFYMFSSVGYLSVIWVVLTFLVIQILRYIKGYFYYKNLANMQREEFIKILNHDLKVSTLAQLRGVELLIKSSKKKDMELLCDIQDSCNYTFDMITTLINSYRIDAGQENLHFEKCSLTELVSEIIGEASHIMKKKNIKLKKYLIPNGYLQADKFALAKALTILMDFVFEYSFDNSMVVIYAREQDKCLEFNIGFVGKYSNKNEIDEKKLDAQQFATVGQNIKMRLCKKIIEKHGGKISHFNKDNGLKFFSLSLPLQNRMVTS